MGFFFVAAIKQEALETEQTFARVGLYADTRIGELLRELPKAKNQYDISNLPTGKTQTVKDAGLTPKTASQLEQLAANPEVVQAVLDKAEAEVREQARLRQVSSLRKGNKAPLGSKETDGDFSIQPHTETKPKGRTAEILTYTKPLAHDVRKREGLLRGAMPIPHGTDSL